MLNNQFSSRKWSIDVLVQLKDLMKYKKVKGFCGYHQLSLDERRNAMNFLSKDQIQKTENKYFEDLRKDIRQCHRDLNRLCNLFKFQLSFENYS